jgi:NodT family efflux transporter outer membrane factor (OMF) lipoprotein
VPTLVVTGYGGDMVGSKIGGGRWARALPAAGSLLLLAACATQPAYRAPTLATPAAWSGAVSSPAEPVQLPEAWWTRLTDPAIDALTAAALADSPTLAQAVARLDEARANLGVSASQRLPAIDATAGLSRARNAPSAGSGQGGAFQSTQASAGLALSWELDLFGRVRSSVEIAEYRIDARSADADAARLTLAAQVGTEVLTLRACGFSRRVLNDDIASREKVLALTDRRLETGSVAPVEAARARSGLADARTRLAIREESCARSVNALAALTGETPQAIAELVAADLPAGQALPARSVPFVMPLAPPASLALPAEVLLRHPNVVSAEREVAASWSDIAVARAERLPRVDLAALLTGQWLRAAGMSSSATTWALGPSLSASVFDGGRGAANVDAAQARYRAALAGLRVALRLASQDVENALAAGVSAQTRLLSAGEAADASQTLLSASEAQWREGAISLFELEDARRQFAGAQDSAIAAAQDSGQAWIELVRASGSATTAAATGPLGLGRAESLSSARLSPP